MDEIYYDLQQAIDFAFVQNKYILNSFSYLKVKNVKRVDAQELLRSSLVQELYSYISDLNLNLKGGQHLDILYVEEAYGFLSRADAKRISTYFDNIIEGIKKYIQMRKGGTRKPKPEAKSK
jgi:hypothetical protein